MFQTTSAGDEPTAVVSLLRQTCSFWPNFTNGDVHDMIFWRIFQFRAKSGHERRWDAGMIAAGVLPPQTIEIPVRAREEEVFLRDRGSRKDAAELALDLEKVLVRSDDGIDVVTVRVVRLEVLRPVRDV